MGTDVNTVDIHAGVRAQQRMVFGFDPASETYNIVSADQDGLLTTKQMVWDESTSSWVPSTPGSGGLTDAELRAAPVNVTTNSLPLPAGAATETTAQAIRDRLPSDGIQPVLDKLNWFTRTIQSVFGRFSFDSSSQLRTVVGGSVAISSGTISTVTTVTTDNISIGDTGKAATAILMTINNSNFTRLTRV
jgi:hypothetical protein